MSAGLNSSTKFTKWTIFRDGLAKTTKLTIFTIFGHGFRTIQPNFYPFQSGPAYFTILTEIAKFTNFVFFRQIFMRICHNVSPFVLYIITVAETPPPPFPLSEGEDTSLNNTSSKQHCCYATLSEVRRVNFDCKDGETWENMPSIFLSLFSQFSQFWLFLRGPSLASDSHVKGPAKFCYFRYFRNFRNALANVLGFFITEFNHRQYSGDWPNVGRGKAWLV